MSAINLATSVGDDPDMAMRFEWPRQTLALLHDAAAAHALIDAIDGVLSKTAARDVYDVAREILRERFGLDGRAQG